MVNIVSVVCNHQRNIQSLSQRNQTFIDLGQLRNVFRALNLQEITIAKPFFYQAADLAAASSSPSASSRGTSAEGKRQIRPPSLGQIPLTNLCLYAALVEPIKMGLGN
ncbi:MAG: hypothetical protein Ct9H300mP11_16110 [Chloroflexota bacterium]|nr:MAG: hypothetical protein Ct9H300mP11_16110 [Chloroflexota bacterium]